LGRTNKRIYKAMIYAMRCHPTQEYDQELVAVVSITGKRRAKYKQRQRMLRGLVEMDPWSGLECLTYFDFSCRIYRWEDLKARLTDRLVRDDIITIKSWPKGEHENIEDSKLEVSATTIKWVFYFEHQEFFTPNLTT